MDGVAVLVQAVIAFAAALAGAGVGGFISWRFHRRELEQQTRHLGVQEAQFAKQQEFAFRQTLASIPSIALEVSMVNLLYQKRVSIDFKDGNDLPFDEVSDYVADITSKGAQITNKFGVSLALLPAHAPGQLRTDLQWAMVAMSTVIERLDPFTPQDLGEDNVTNVFVSHLAETLLQETLDGMVAEFAILKDWFGRTF